MDNIKIIYPMFALVFLSFFMGFYLLKLRMLAVKKQQINPRYFKLNRGGKVPDKITQVSHNYDNLLALPMLFYVLLISLYVTDRVESAQIIMAWFFVISRYLHSYIHVSYNHILHRMLAFVSGVIVLSLMWLLFLWRLIAFSIS